MRKIKFILLAVLCVFSLSSCWYEDFEEEIKHIYKVDSLRLSVDQRSFIKIIPSVTEDWTFDAESRQFYIAADTSLVIKGRRHKLSSKWEYMFWAIDWRITKIDVIAMEDYDENHPAGEPLNDLFSITYRCRDRKEIEMPVSEIGYGDIMLGYYVPGGIENYCLKLWPKEGATKPSKFEIRIEDAFGRVFVAISEEEKPRK